MSWHQREILLSARSRGFHLVTRELVAAMPEIGRFSVGLAHLFIRHTSAALALNENADPTVRADMEAYFSRLAPERAPYYTHTLEGPDDMPAHIRTALTHTSLSIPVTKGALALGTWQGIFLFEHRSAPHRREIVLHLIGE